MKRLSLVLWSLVFVVAFSAAAKAQSTKKKGKSIEKNVKQPLTYKEYEEAIPQLTELLKYDPGNAYYNYWMGKCLYITYKKNQALKYFQITGEKNPSIDVEFHWYYALTLHYNQEFDLAIAEYSKDLERFEPGSDIYTELTKRISQCQFARKLKTTSAGNKVIITNLGASINSEFAEHSPVISANDSVLLYTSARPECLGSNIKAQVYDKDIFLSLKKEGTWAKSENILFPVNSKENDATVSLTADGQTLFFNRHKKASQLFSTQFDALSKKWKEPIPVEKPFLSKNFETSICQSADGKIKFFTSNKPGGMGGKDIYMVKLVGNQWTDPQNLGPTINTPFDETSPFFHPDGKTLYYSSNGPNSVGGYDIFVTEWDFYTDTWLEPLNLGLPVNTPEDDLSFVINKTGLTGYYSSGKEGGFGNEDIYGIEFPAYPYPKRNYELILDGIVLDAGNLQPVNAMIKLMEKSSGHLIDSILTDPVNHKYHFDLKPGMDYSIEANSDGYSISQDILNTPSILDDDISFVKNLIITRIEIVKDVPKIIQQEEIQNLYFDFGKSLMRNESAQELEPIVEALKKDPETMLEIHAHTDWFGNFNYNLELSKRRSVAVVEYLISRGIDANRMSQFWYSENTPIETNENDEGRQYNRRVEFQLIKNGKSFLTSSRVRKGKEGPRVDHTKPKGLPGFDDPQGRKFSSSGNGGNSSEPKTNIFEKDKNRISIKDGITGISMIRNIYFEYDRSDINKDAIQMLNYIASLLEENKDYILEIKGHTDDSGSERYNLNLSESRSLSVLSYLKNLGLPESRLGTIGFGESVPLETNESESGRKLNRRVEFTIRSGEKIVMASIN